MKYFRFLLFPISLIYALIIGSKNWCYNVGIFKPYLIPVKSIIVGNLSMGGTGKSPMVGFLITHLKEYYKINTLSRGYGRQTKGFILLKKTDSASQVGDEPLMYKKGFGDEIEVAVCEARKEGVERLLQQNKPDLLILDDAFQHRKVKGGLSIVLTNYGDLFCDDFLLPVGNLREFRSGVNRADIVVVSKCPSSISEAEKKNIRSKLELQKQDLFFSNISYGEWKPIFADEANERENVLLVTGIANPKPLEEHLAKSYNVSVLSFPDHHNYNVTDIENIHKKFGTFASDKKVIVTTEKDFVRFSSDELCGLMKDYPWYYQPITIQLDQEEEFLKRIKTYVRKV